jgi:hypothetical protein
MLIPIVFQPSWQVVQILRNGTMVEQKKRLFRAKNDVRLKAVILFSAPFTDGCYVVLSKGDIVTIDGNGYHGDDWYQALPDRYKELEKDFIPEDSRNYGAYGGYALIITFSELEQHFEEIF